MDNGTDPIAIAGAVRLEARSWMVCVVYIAITDQVELPHSDANIFIGGEPRMQVASMPRKS